MAGEPERRVAVVIEDDADIRNLLAALLHEAGFETHLTSSGLDGLDAVREYNPILTTLDISLPGIDGFEVARRLRVFSHTYLIMLSARTEEIDTLMGLDAGADDYLTKPFRPRELRARVEAMLRRTRAQGHRALIPGASSESSPDDLAPGVATAAETGQSASSLEPSGGDATSTGRSARSNGDLSATQPVGTQPVGTQPVGTQPVGTQPVGDDGDEPGWLQHNGLRLHPEMRLSELDGKSIELTRSEFDLMLSIMQRRRRVISKNELVLELRGDSDIGGYVSDSDRRSVEVHLANLRRKLNDPVSAPRFVQTVRGVGYRLATPQH